MRFAAHRTAAVLREGRPYTVYGARNALRSASSILTVSSAALPECRAAHSMPPLVRSIPVIPCQRLFSGRYRFISCPIYTLAGVIPPDPSTPRAPLTIAVLTVKHEFPVVKSFLFQICHAIMNTPFSVGIFSALIELRRFL